jgi:hypothetical protein
MQRIFEPNDNAILVSSSSGQGTTNPDYKSELEAYRNERMIATIMRERTSVCG